MGVDLAGDASLVLNACGASDGQDFDYALHPPPIKKYMKMYIAVLDEVPDHMVPVLVAHSVLGAHLESGNLSNKEIYLEWLALHFKKCVLKVNRKEFNKIALLDGVYLGHENTVLDGDKSCAVLYPRLDWPNVVKFAKMWKPSYV